MIYARPHRPYFSVCEAASSAPSSETMSTSFQDSVILFVSHFTWPVPSNFELNFSRKGDSITQSWEAGSFAQRMAGEVSVTASTPDTIADFILQLHTLAS